MEVRDRVEFGFIAAFFGAALGGIVAVVVTLLHGLESDFEFAALYYGAAFFFVAGCIRGVDAAETVVDSLVAALVFVLGVIGVVGNASIVDGDVPEWRSTMWWPICFFSGLALVVWWFW